MLYSESGKFDPLFITNYALINVLDELSRTPGVGEAHLFGRLNYSMRIWFDVARLKSLGLARPDRGYLHPAQRRTGRRDRDLSDARCQRHPDRGSGECDLGPSARTLPARTADARHF